MSEMYRIMTLPDGNVSELSQIDPPEDTLEQLYTLEEIAGLLGFGIGVVYKLVDRREITAIKINRSWRVRKSAYDAFLASRPTNAKSDTPQK